VLTDPPPLRPPLLPIVLETKTGVSYLSNEKPYYAAVAYDY